MKRLLATCTRFLCSRPHTDLRALTSRQHSYCLETRYLLHALEAVLRGLLGLVRDLGVVESAVRAVLVVDARNASEFSRNIRLQTASNVSGVLVARVGRLGNYTQQR